MTALKPFGDTRTAARAVLLSSLSGGLPLSPREAQFLGGLSFDLNPASPKQLKWLSILLGKHDLPEMEGGSI